MPLRAILFDIDGTLVDSNEQHVDDWVAAFAQAGHPQPADAIRAQIGKGGDLLVPALLPEAGEALRARISALHGDLFKTLHLAGVRPFADATALVRAVHARGLKVVLASSAKREEIDHYIRLLDIAPIVDAATAIDDVDNSKPEPDVFAAALERVGVDADEAIIVGDTPYDIEAGARAGIAAIGLTSGPFDAARLRAAGAIAVYPGVAALLADLDRSPLAG